MDFGPVRERIDRARGHAFRVEDLAGAWASGAVRIERSANDDAVTYRAGLTSDPPVEIALALGDVLQESRVALDDLVGFLRGEPASQSAFPIEATWEEFETAAATKLEGLPEWAVAAIRDLQPVPTNPYRWIGDSVRSLDDLAVVDRQRPLVLRGALLDLDKFGTMDLGEDAHSSAMRRDWRALIVASPDAYVEVRVLVDESAAAIATYPYHLEAAGLALQAVTTAAVVTDTIERAARRARSSAG